MKPGLPSRKSSNSSDNQPANLGGQEHSEFKSSTSSDNRRTIEIRSNEAIARIAPVRIGHIVGGKNRFVASKKVANSWVLE